MAHILLSCICAISPLEVSMDNVEALLAATQQLGNAAASYGQYKQGEDALEQNQNQFSANLEELKREYDSTMAFANLQHSQQMDFANRQLQANKDIANQNFNLSKEYQEKNLSLQQQAFDYQKLLNNTMMEREDNAIQRQVADYAKAGFSPLAAIGGNGASAGSMSTHSPSQINAPQYDMSGINQAAGVYVDFAKQYAALSMTARQDYSRNRSQLAEKHNSEITASRIALQQMRADMRYKNQSASTELFNAAVNYKDSLLNREYLRNQINEQPNEYKRAQEEHDWYQKNGYYSRGFEPYIVSIIDKLSDKLDKNNDGTSLDEAGQFIKDKGGEISNFVSHQWDKLYDSTKEKIMSIDDKKLQVAASFYWSCIFSNTKLGKLTKGAAALYNLGKSAYEKISEPKSNGDYSFIKLY